MDEIKYASENNDFEFSYEIQENYDVDQACQDAVQTLLNFHYCSDIFENCFDFSLTEKSDNSENFKAISSYQWEFWNFMNISKSSLTMGEASQKIIEICNTNTMPNRFGETDCFEVSYIFNILTNAYGFQVRELQCIYCNNFHSIAKAKGQLILICIFGVIVLTKIATNILQGFLP